MAVLDRIILSVVIVVLLVMGVLAAATTFGNNMLLDWLIRIQTVKLDGFLLVLIILLLALYLVLMLVTELKTDKRAIVSQTPLGMCGSTFRLSRVGLSGCAGHRRVKDISQYR